MATAMDESAVDNREAPKIDAADEARPDYRQQLIEVKQTIDMTQLKEGESWYLVDVRWFKQWKLYVGYDYWNQYNAGQESAVPGPIDNTDLFKDESFTDLKPNMIDELDYHLLPSVTWVMLSTWYGIADGQDPVERKVISQGQYMKHLKVEVYMTDVKLCLFTDQDTVKVKKFSKAKKLENIVKEMKELFNVQDGLAVRLWSKYMSSYFERLDRMDLTLQDCSIYTGQSLVLEVKNEDDSWPRDKSGSEAQYRQSSSSTSSAIGNRSSYNTYYGYSNYSSESYNRTSKPGLTGLSNLGNTCFMNSALQCLSNTPPLTKYFLDNIYRDDINRENPLGMKGKIAEAYGSLLLDLWGGSLAVSPRRFKTEVGQFAPQFVGYQQHDSQELLAFLLDGLHEDLNRVKKKPYVELKDSFGRQDEEVAHEAWTNHRKRNDSVIVDLIQGQFKSTVLCPKCQRMSVTFDPFMYLTLPLPVKRTRLMRVVLVKLDPMDLPTNYCVTVPKHGTVASLAKELATVSGVDHRKLVFADVYSSRLHKIFSYKEKLTLIYDRDDLYAYEVPVERDDDPDTIVLKVYHRELRARQVNSYYSGTYNYTSSSLFGWPFLVAVPRNTTTYGSLYQHLIRHMGRYVRYPSQVAVNVSLDNREFEESSTARRRLLDIANDDESNETEPNGSGIGVEAVSAQDNNGADMAESFQGNNSNGLLMNHDNDKNHPSRNVSDLEENCTTAHIETDTQNQMETEEKPEASLSEVQGVDKNKQVVGEVDQNLIKECRPKLFNMVMVNSFGSSELRQLEQDDNRPIQFRGHSYLALDWNSDIKNEAIDSDAFKKKEDDESVHTTVETEPKKQVCLEDCIELFTDTEKLSEEDPWYCSQCKEFQQADKTMKLWRLPQVLIVHLKRFSYDRYWRDKLDTLVEFPVINLDMSKHVVNKDDPSCKLYDLCAISNHYGGLGGGHYTAYCKNKDTGKWYHFDDSSVSEVDSTNRLVSKAAYVLIYLRQDISKEVMRQRSISECRPEENDDDDEDMEDSGEKSREAKAEQDGSESVEMKVDEAGSND